MTSVKSFLLAAWLTSVKATMWTSEQWVQNRYNVCFGESFSLRTSPRNYLLGIKNCGIELGAEYVFDWTHKPSIMYAKAKTDVFYTVVMVEPADHCEDTEYYLHWLELNIAGQRLQVGRPLTHTTTVSDYQRPKSFSNGGGRKIFQFLIFEQSARMFYTGRWYHEVKQRTTFKVHQFLRNQVTHFIGPLAGLQFIVFVPPEEEAQY